ncbi:hypothetical protein HED54_12870 [Ochrobactrum anthropi ATCC 49188]|nr:hypothetical protein [Brucella anthropi ATCC 49188]
MTYDEILKEEDLQFPWRLKPLLKCRDNQDYGSQSWSYYAYSYDRAFEIMARHTLEYPINNQSLTIPLFYLARHSMELALEEALREIAHIGVDDARTDGHDLLKLYDDLQKYSKITASTTMGGGAIIVGEFSLTYTAPIPKENTSVIPRR